jgi:hypothetical protein
MWFRRMDQVMYTLLLSTPNNQLLFLKALLIKLPKLHKAEVCLTILKRLPNSEVEALTFCLERRQPNPNNQFSKKTIRLKLISLGLSI